MGMFDSIRFDKLTSISENSPPILPMVYQTKDLYSTLFLYDVVDSVITNFSEAPIYRRRSEIVQTPQPSEKRHIVFYASFKDKILEYLKDEQLPTGDSNKVLFWINCFKGDWIEYHVELTGPKITKMISMSNASQTLWSAEDDQ